MFSPDVWVVDGNVFSSLDLSKLFHNSQNNFDRLPPQSC